MRTTIRGLTCKTSLAACMTCTIGNRNRACGEIDDLSEPAGVEALEIVDGPSLTAGLSTRTPVRADEHPAAVYLARLAPGSRRTMASSLDIVAGLLTSNRCNFQTLDWSA